MFDFDEIMKEARTRQEAFDKLNLDRSSKVPEVGDRVVFAAGMIGHGFMWVRLEAKVIEIGETSYKLEWGNKKETYSYHVEWVHPALITDVLPRKAKKG